jgi:hypothetical protein
MSLTLTEVSVPRVDPRSPAAQKIDTKRRTHGDIGGLRLAVGRTATPGIIDERRGGEHP